MSCLFTSCLGRSRGYGAGDSTLRPRRVLVRNSVEKTDTFSYSRSSVQDTTVDTDEKTALNEYDSLLDDYDEDAEERSTLLSEKDLEAGVEGTLQVRDQTTQTRRLIRKSIGFRPRKKPAKISAAPLSPHNTGDELHRRAEFETSVKKMSREDQQRAWAVERTRREGWKNDRRNSKQR